MANWVTGKGTFGLKIVHADGDIEHAWFTNGRERDKVYTNMNNDKAGFGIKSIDKVKKK